MGDSNLHLNKTMSSIGVPDTRAPCECLFVCICGSKNGAHDTPIPDDYCSPGPGNLCVSNKGKTNVNKTLERNSITRISAWSIIESTLQTDKTSSPSCVPNIPCGSSKGKSSESDPDICHACALKIDRPKAHKSCRWGSSGILSNKLDSYVFASHLFDHFLLQIKVKNKDKTNNMKMEYYDQILEIYLKVCSTEKELDKNDFIEMTNILKCFKEKGLVTENIISNFNTAITENGYMVSEIDELSDNISGLNIDDCNQTPDALKHFNTASNKFYGSIYRDVVGDMKVWEGFYPKEIYAKIMEPFEKGDTIRSRLNILNSLDFVVVMCDIEFFQIEGWLCHCDLSNFIEVDKLATHLTTEIGIIANQLKHPVSRITNGLKINPNGYIEYDVWDRELPIEDANKELMGVRVCISGHNTPLCGMCGSQSSWLTTFKKRGIKIREANSNNKKHIWYNDTKDK